MCDVRSLGNRAIPESGEQMNRKFCTTLFISAFLLVLFPLSVSAHPLGNFTVNHLTLVQPLSHRIEVQYYLDMAEIPTFQVMHAASPKTQWSKSQLDAWADDEAQVLQAQLAIYADDVRLPLHETSVHVRLRSGAGGLPTLYLVGNFQAELGASAHHVRIVDDTFPGRKIGWSDVVVLPANGANTPFTRLSTDIACLTA